MLQPTDLKLGTIFEIDGAPHLVLEYSHIKMGRGGATIKVKVKNLKTNSIVLKSFGSNEKLNEAKIERKKVQFLYQDSSFHFMENETYEQLELSATLAEPCKKFLKEGLSLHLLIYNNAPISLELPIKEVYKITEAEPGIKGDRANPGTKKATIETGLTLNVPLFIKKDDLIVVNTQEGTYVERAK